jgi:hypothetical protein
MPTSGWTAARRRTVVGDSYSSALLMTLGKQGTFVPDEVQGLYPTFHQELTHYLETHDAIYIGTLRSPTKRRGDLVLWHPPYVAIHFPK